MSRAGLEVISPTGNHFALVVRMSAKAQLQSIESMAKGRLHAYRPVASMTIGFLISELSAWIFSPNPLEKS